MPSHLIAYFHSFLHSLFHYPIVLCVAFAGHKISFFACWSSVQHEVFSFPTPLYLFWFSFFLHSFLSIQSYSGIFRWKAWHGRVFFVVVFVLTVVISFTRRMLSPLLALFKLLFNDLLAHILGYLKL